MRALTLAAALVAAGCVTPARTESPTAPPTAAPSPAAFDGFDLPLQTNTFWDFAWDTSTSSFQAGGGLSRSSSRTAGTARVLLGDQARIDGVAMFGVRVQKISGDAPTGITPWKYLGMDGGRIVGSLDGARARVVFDPQRGKQPGGGFFDAVAEDRLLTLSSGSVKNDYITGQAVVLGDAGSSGGCEYFPGYGNICAGKSESFTRREYHRAGVGPIAYYYNASTSSGSGGSSITRNIGLIAYAFSGTPPPIPVATETPRPGFVRLTDRTGAFSVDVPAEFTDRRTQPAGGGDSVPTVAASTDLARLAAGTAPGVEVRFYPDLGRSTPPIDLIRRLAARATAVCTTAQAPVATGDLLAWAAYRDCPGGAALAYAVIHTPDRPDALLSLMLQVTPSTAGKYGELLDPLLSSVIVYR